MKFAKYLLFGFLSLSHISTAFAALPLPPERAIPAKSSKPQPVLDKKSLWLKQSLKLRAAFGFNGDELDALEPLISIDGLPHPQFIETVLNRAADLVMASLKTKLLDLAKDRSQKPISIKQSETERDLFEKLVQYSEQNKFAELYIDGDESQYQNFLSTVQWQLGMKNSQKISLFQRINWRHSPEERVQARPVTVHIMLDVDGTLLKEVNPANISSDEAMQVVRYKSVKSVDLSNFVVVRPAAQLLIERLLPLLESGQAKIYLTSFKDNSRTDAICNQIMINGRSLTSLGINAAKVDDFKARNYKKSLKQFRTNKGIRRNDRLFAIDNSVRDIVEAGDADLIFPVHEWTEKRARIHVDSIMSPSDWMVSDYLNFDGIARKVMVASRGIPMDIGSGPDPDLQRAKEATKKVSLIAMALSESAEGTALFRMKLPNEVRMFLLNRYRFWAQANRSTKFSDSKSSAATSEDLFAVLYSMSDEDAIEGLLEIRNGVESLTKAAMNFGDEAAAHYFSWALHVDEKVRTKSTHELLNRILNSTTENQLRILKYFGRDPRWLRYSSLTAPASHIPINTSINASIKSCESLFNF
jgi:hypothetical protein